MAALDRHNDVLNFDIADLEPRIQREIGRLIERLRLERDAKRGVVPTWPPISGPSAVDGEKAAGPPTP